MGSAAPLSGYDQVRDHSRNQQPHRHRRAGRRNDDGRLSLSVRLERNGTGVATHEIPIRGINRAYLNQAKGIFTDVRAREAFYSAIDRARLMQAFTQMPGYKAPSNYFGENSPYFDSASSLPAYDPKKAQELFDALKADGKPFSIKIVTYTNSDLKRLAAYIQQVLTGYEGASAEIVEVDQPR